MKTPKRRSCYEDITEATPTITTATPISPTNTICKPEAVTNVRLPDLNSASELESGVQGHFYDETEGKSEAAYNVRLPDLNPASELESGVQGHLKDEVEDISCIRKARFVMFC